MLRSAAFSSVALACRLYGLGSMSHCCVTKVKFLVCESAILCIALRAPMHLYQCV